jgi:pyruvate kinase
MTTPSLPPRKTKIICTLGPASESPEILRQLMEAGANVFRLNMSHAKHEWVRMMVTRIREVAESAGTHIGILMDTQGPAIRTGEVSSKLDLKPGDILEFTVRGARSEEMYSVDVNYDGLVDDISPGDVVLVDNGVIRLRVMEKEKNRIRSKVLTPGQLGSRRHINLPGVRVNLPALTEKDRADVALGAELGADMVALSFCKERKDIEELRALLEEHRSNARIVAKFEDQMAVRNLDELIHVSDAVMVARGDLGVECPIEELPIIQRRLIKRAIRFGKPVIVATHMLESMIQNPMPTRAEITDVANAVFEQADAIMLSGESAMGQYPVECVRVLDRVARRIERSGGAGYGDEVEVTDTMQKTVRAAVVLANSLTNARIVVFTRRGMMAGRVSNFRPQRAQIFAFTPFVSTCRRMVLQWGVTPIEMPFRELPHETIEAAERLLKERGHVKTGDHLVIVSNVLAGRYEADSIQLRTIA